MSELVKSCGSLTEKAQVSLIWVAGGLALFGLAKGFQLLDKIVEKCNTFSYDQETKKFQATLA